MRRDLRTIVALALAAASPALAQPAPTDREVAALTARVERLEGARAVKKLQRAFGYYVDRGLWQDAADLFADDGTIEVGIDGVYVGRTRIRDYLKALHGGQDGLIYGQLNEWVTLQPVVDVAADGMTAKARWRDLGMLGQYKSHAEWRDGIYENSYVRENGVWKIKSLHLFVNFAAPLEKGWARLKPGEGLVQSAASKMMPADRPPSVAVKGFPDPQWVPIHAAVRPAVAPASAALAPYAQRVARLEDQDAIENLQATYGYLFDKGRWADVAALFSATGSFEYGQRGVYVGRERIRRALLLVGPEGPTAGTLNNHMQLQGIVTVAPDGRTALARWQGMVMLARPDENGVWGVGIYENAYVKEAGVWKLAKLHFYVTAETDYDQGFAKAALPIDGPSALFPPDRPPSEAYRPFPHAFIPPFDFVHPVTGKPIVVTQPADDIVGRK